MAEKRTYTPWQEFPKKSVQREYTVPTPLLGEDGSVQAAGWARHNLFLYDRKRSRPALRSKEWDFYQISDGRLMVQISFANISVAGYASILVLDIEAGKVLVSAMAPFIGGKNRYPLPARGDAPNRLKYKVGKAEVDFITEEFSRTLRFKLNDIRAEFKMDIPEGHENITTVLPFKGKPTRYFMTTKQNCLPCEGEVVKGGEVYRLKKEDTFCVLDWGRVNTPNKLVWYWGNGSQYLFDESRERHTFGFEITWGIGDESAATETCLFYDGKAHKIGAVDVIDFPKPDKYMEPWRFSSEDGRFCLTMTPIFDHHSDMNAVIARMHSHQVHGRWNGTVTLDDGTMLTIKDMYAFCEYVENRW